MSLLRRPSLLIYAACVAAVFAGLVWLTWQAIGLETRERTAREQAVLQESMRLALWRMDSNLSPIIAPEAARPYFQYRAFYPADRAYNRMWGQLEPGEVLVASPLLSGPGQYILLHFEIAPDGSISSPQAPTGDMRAQAEAGTLTPAQIAAAEDRLSELSRFLTRGRDRAIADPLFDKDDAAAPPRPAQQLAMGPAEEQALAKSEKEFKARQQTADYARNIPQEQYRQSAPAPASAAPPADKNEADAKLKAAAADRPDELARAETGAYVADGFRNAGDIDSAGRPAGGLVLGAPSPITQSGLSPRWITGGPGESPQLLFVRRVSLGGADYIQGFWADWPALRIFLLSLVRDDLPAADVQPVYSETGATARRLAAISADIDPGPIVPFSAGLMSPTRVALALTWAAVIAALVAIGIVLRKSIDLAERRGQFVSAVTHELRTPLTTFCLYTQMLADGMVQTDAARSDYLGTLKRESRRLARIVENVLDYARLGQRARHRPAAQPVEDLIAAVAPALTEQASRTGMDLVIDHAAAAGSSTPADTATVERILTNLVENSAKYAADSTDRRLHLIISRRGPSLEVRYRDHGPGIPRSEESRVFQPFHRAVRDADGPTPGLGLGLALSRGLARELGGDLRLVRESGEGAEFLLILPAA